MARAYLYDFMPAVRNQSDKSVAAYKQSLNSYLSFLESEKGLKEAQITFEAFNRSNVKDFVEWLREKKYAPKTINLKLTAIRSFLRYCADEDFELRGIYNDVCTVRKVKEEKKPIEYLQPEATKAILASYDTRTAKHRRNRMILILLYDTGQGYRSFPTSPYHRFIWMCPILMLR
jgi:site-specific recombinase XerD